MWTTSLWILFSELLPTLGKKFGGLRSRAVDVVRVLVGLIAEAVLIAVVTAVLVLEGLNILDDVLVGAETADEVLVKLEVVDDSF